MPNLAKSIPGTGLNRWANIQSDQANLVGAEANARAAAETERDRAEANKALNPPPPKPDPKKYTVAAGVRDDNDEPAVLQTEGEGAGTLTAQPGFNVKPDKPTPPKVDKKIDAYVGGDGTRMEVMQRPDGTTYLQKETDVRDTSGEKGGQGPWVVDPTGHVGRVHEGQTIKEGTQTLTGGLGTETKKIQSANAALEASSYAKSYLAGGNFTGPGDEALMERFFEVAKPTSGFRMTQQQMDMLMKARSWMDSAEAHTLHATKGTYFSDDQRKQIADTMSALQQARGTTQGFGSDQQERPVYVNGVLKGYTVDGKTYSRKAQ